MLFSENDVSYNAPTRSLEIIIPRINTQLKIDSWDQGFNWRIWIEGKWQEMQVDIGIPLLDHVSAACADHPVSRFLQPIPDDLKRRLKPYISVQCFMLKWIKKLSAGAELFRSNPVLFWMVVVSANLEEWQEEDLSLCLSLKQTEILRHLSLKEERVPGGIKLLKKLAAERFTIDEYEIILKLLRSNLPLNPFFHIEKVPVSFLKIFLENTDLSRWIIAQWGKNRANFNLRAFTDDVLINHAWFWETKRLADLFDEDFWPHMHQHVSSIEQLIGYHDQLAVRYQEQRIAQENQRVRNRKWEQLERRRMLIRMTLRFLLRKDRFPRPKIRGNYNIWLIRSAYGLWREGGQQSHCIFSNKEKALYARRFYYRVYYPERATLELGFDGRKYRLKQIKKKGNDPVSSNTLEYVYKWLNKQNSRLTLIRKVVSD